MKQPYFVSFAKMDVPIETLTLMKVIYESLETRTVLKIIYGGSG